MHEFCLPVAMRIKLMITVKLLEGGEEGETAVHLPFGCRVLNLMIE